MAKLSVVVSAYNEENNIAKCLSSIKGFADEIVVVDNSSTDRTRAIAKKFTDKVYSQANNPKKIDLQKNYGFSKATGDWILSLDADERLTLELKEEIERILMDESAGFEGYLIPRKNMIFGKWIKHTGWYPDFQLRLFKKGAGKFVHNKVHEKISINGEIGELSSPLLHENYQTINQFINRMIIYTDSEAEALIKKGYKLEYNDALRMPIQEFLRRFFVQEGYKDGIHGLALSVLMSFYHFVVFLKIWEVNKFVSSENSLELFSKESRKLGKEMGFWVNNSKAKESKNPFKKIIYKSKQKLVQ